MQRNVLVADADPERRLSLIEAIRDGVTTVTAIGQVAANADEFANATITRSSSASAGRPRKMPRRSTRSPVNSVNRYRG